MEGFTKKEELKLGQKEYREPGRKGWGKGSCKVIFRVKNPMRMKEDGRVWFLRERRR